MVRWLTWLRWLLVVPAAWVAWYAAVLIGFGLHSLAEALCPPDQVISGMCVAPWFGAVDRAIFCTGAGLAAAFIIVSCTVVAPSHCRVVTFVTLGTGSVVALVLALATDALPEFVAAVVAGLLATWWLRGRTRLHEPPDIPSEATAP